MEEIAIYLLGTLYVERDEEIVETFKTDVERALLARLALARGVPLRRDQLAALFSPDRTNRDARIYLSNAFGRLRKALDTPTLFGSNRHELWLEGGAWVDSAEFTTLHNAVQTHPHRALAGCQLCLDRLQRAADLYRGELLTGFYFDSDLWDSWLLAQREHFQQRAVETLTQLADAQAQRGAWEAVQPVARQLLTIEAWHEGAHRHLIAAHLAQGDRGAAVAQYEQCEAILAEELGVEPNAETLALLEQDRRVAQAEIPVVLPSWETPFFGRTTELEQLQTLLTDPHYRFVTLVGEGGVGKSRLAVEAARRLRNSYPDGVFFVPLAGLTTDEAAALEVQISGAIASAVGLTFTPQGSPQSQLFNYLRDKSLLLVLDNWEHVIDGAGVVRELLTRARTISVLCTSRQPLGFQAEQIVWLDGLPLPEAEGEAARFSLVQLFAERARRVARRFALSAENIATIVQIGRLLDGNPLGIELAAAATQSRPAPQIAAAIERSMDSLKTRFRDMPARQRSLRATFDYSWSLLTRESQTLLSQLAVMRGDFSAAAAYAITHATRDDLDNLIHVSLLQLRDGRFVLHESIRAFAAERLETAQTYRAHADYYTNLLAAQAPRFERTEPLAAQQVVATEFSNMRAALGWCCEAGVFRPLITSARGLMWYLLNAGRFQEGIPLLRSLLATLEAHDDAALAQAWLRYVLAWCVGYTGDIETANALTDRVLATALRHEEGQLLLFTQLQSGEGLGNIGRFAEAEAIYQQAQQLATDLNDLFSLAEVHYGLASVYFRQGNVTAAHEQSSLSLSIAQANGFLIEIFSALNGLSRLEMEAQRWETARQHLVEMRDVAERIGSEMTLAHTTAQLASVEHQLGNHEQAIALAEDAVRRFDKLGELASEVLARQQLSEIYGAMGRSADAQTERNRAIALAREHKRDDLLARL